MSPPLNLGAWLKAAERELSAAGVPSARLDAQLIAGHATGRDRAWILAHNEYIFNSQEYNQAAKIIAARSQRVPLAYLFGTKEFYGRQFSVTPDVLIPRPETETLVDAMAALHPLPGDKLCDIGTGSGAIAITAALQWPGLRVTATDISPAAVTVARNNARALQADVTFLQSDLTANLPTEQFQFICANLPYVDEDWQCSPETAHEPALALFAPDEGLALIRKLIKQAPDRLATRAYMLLEADPRQHAAIVASAATSFRHISTDDFILTLQKA